MLGILVLMASLGNEVEAQTCGTDYAIKEGESLADIASRVYGSTSQWTLIFYANQDRLGSNASMLVPGLSLRIPCVAGQQAPSPAATTTSAPSASAAPTPGRTEDMELSSVVKRIEFLTADGFTPFTDRSQPNGGMFTEIATASMDYIKDKAAGGFSYNISWVNDWAAHLNPLLATRAFDVGFPWLKPDCTKLAELSSDAKYRCQKFLFSDPVYEVFTVIFVKSNSPITFAKDEEFVGKSLCLVAGQSTYELDKSGRNWIKDNKVILLRPQTIEECFKLLDNGSVSGVVATDLTGKAVAAALGYSDKIKQLPRPLGIGTLHFIVPKTHPHASTILYYINTSIARLRDEGEYDKIVDSHLSRFWNASDRK
jgi:polar amino acid transport system substrate-binding protein